MLRIFTDNRKYLKMLAKFLSHGFLSVKVFKLNRVKILFVTVVFELYLRSTSLENVLNNVILQYVMKVWTKREINLRLNCFLQRILCLNNPASICNGLSVQSKYCRKLSDCCQDYLQTSPDKNRPTQVEQKIVEP